MANSGHSQSADHGLRSLLVVYWRSYGGALAVLRSPFFWVSVALAIVSFHYWLTDLWWDQVLSVLPNLLGFTLGGFAIFLAFGDERFLELISGQDPGDEDDVSPYLQVSATFLHFVLVQAASLMVALIAKATWFVLPGDLACVSAFLYQVRPIGDLLGYWLFLYGLCSAAAAALAIFRVAYWFDRFKTTSRL